MKAYPFLHKHPTTGETRLDEGMDLRDWFAGQAMLGFVAKYPYADQVLVWRSYQVADAMIKEREKKYE